MCQLEIESSGFYSVLLFLLINLPLSGINYFVKNAGNDSNAGLSDAQAWKTITKVNSAFSTFKPGDMVLFKKGNTFYGTLNISASGASVNPIVIGSYGSGANPNITDFIKLSGWTNENGGVYSIAVTSEALTNMVTIDGLQYGMGRYPHDSWLTFDSHRDTTSITNNSLSSSTDWTGALKEFIKPYLLSGLKITHANQLWCNDITYIPMAKGFMYLTAIMLLITNK